MVSSSDLAFTGSRSNFVFQGSGVLSILEPRIVYREVPSIQAGRSQSLQPGNERLQVVDMHLARWGIAMYALNGVRHIRQLLNDHRQVPPRLMKFAMQFPGLILLLPDPRPNSQSS
ncbi:hypothetical protein ACJZ2D_001453 [Fusarium nematophilum]